MVVFCENHEERKRRRGRKKDLRKKKAFAFFYIKISFSFFLLFFFVPLKPAALPMIFMLELQLRRHGGFLYNEKNSRTWPLVLFPQRSETAALWPFGRTGKTSGYLDEGDNCRSFSPLRATRSTRKQQRSAHASQAFPCLRMNLTLKRCHHRVNGGASYIRHTWQSAMAQSFRTPE